MQCTDILKPWTQILKWWSLKWWNYLLKIRVSIFCVLSWLCSAYEWHFVYSILVVCSELMSEMYCNDTPPPLEIQNESTCTPHIEAFRLKRNWFRVDRGPHWESIAILLYNTRVVTFSASLLFALVLFGWPLFTVFSLSVNGIVTKIETNGSFDTAFPRTFQIFLNSNFIRKIMESNRHYSKCPSIRTFIISFQKIGFRFDFMFSFGFVFSSHI